MKHSTHKVGDHGMSKKVTKRILASEHEDSSGARVRRSVGCFELPNLDPFLILDEIHMGPQTCFPDHPHRGFESVTYMLSGAMRHDDSTARSSHVVQTGDLQMMRCGRGIIHCEMSEAGIDCLLLNFWLNTKSRDKMLEPKTVVLSSQDIPSSTEKGVTLKVVAGTGYNGVKSPMYTRTPTLYLDIKLDPGASVSQPVPLGWTTFVHVLSGTAVFGGTEGQARHFLVLGWGDRVDVFNKGHIACRFVLVAGKPIHEPVARTGSYVMNTLAEIIETEEDFYKQKNGFEGTRLWHSFIVNKRDVRL